jgi:hypothetical protein
MKLCLLMVATLSCTGFFGVEAHGGEASSILSFLQSEHLSTSSAHSSIRNLLKGKSIPIDGCSTKHSPSRKHASSPKSLVISLSTEDNPIECRVSLQHAAVGSKCIAPCGCIGSQRWITFSELNKLRRIEPTQWITCQTCQQNFDFSELGHYGGVYGNIVSLLLDNVTLLRLQFIVAFIVFSYATSFEKLLQRFMVSKVLWQFYPKWSKIIHLPLVLKFWGGKIALQYLLEKYVNLEKEVVKWLADIETGILEPNLPVTD